VQGRQFYGLSRPAGGNPRRDASFRGYRTIGLRTATGATAILAPFMSAPSPNPASSSSARWLTWPFRLLMLLAACGGFAAIWVVLAWSTGKQCGWMVLIGALAVAWILRLSGWPGGARRAAVGALATAAIAVLANWWIIAVHLGEMLGFDPLDSALRLGIQHAWLLAQLANSTLDLAMIAVAVVLAALISR
jgi:hypothetical protein